MNTTQTYEASSLLSRSHDLPAPLLDGDGGAGEYPTEGEETGP